jgi:hypothetical protein
MFLGKINNNKKYIYKFFTDFKKFDKDSDHTTPQEKYKDFTLDQLKTFTENKKKEDAYFQKKTEQFFSKTPFELKRIARSLYTRNFLKRKSSTEEKDRPSPKRFELDLTMLKDLNLDEPICLYEMDEGALKLLKVVNMFFYGYIVMNIPISYLMLASPKIIFTKTTIAYFTVYFMNFMTCLAIWLNIKVMRSFVIDLQYIHKENSLVIKKLQSIVNLHNIEERRYKVEELEYITSGKMLETEFVLRVKDKPWVVYNLNESIWFYRNLLEDLYFKK